MREGEPGGEREEVVCFYGEGEEGVEVGFAGEEGARWGVGRAEEVEVECDGVRGEEVDCRIGR